MIHSQKEISIGHFGAMDDSNINHHLISISLWHFSKQLLIFQFSIFGQFLTGSAIVLRSKLAAIFARGRFNQFLWLSATFSTSLLSASEAWRLQKKSLRSKGQLISKWFLGSSISSKKRRNEFVFTSMQRVFVRFFEEIDDLKKPFRN